MRNIERKWEIDALKCIYWFSSTTDILATTNVLMRHHDTYRVKVLWASMNTIQLDLNYLNMENVNACVHM